MTKIIAFGIALLTIGWVQAAQAQELPAPSALQKHVMFFDVNQDGIITVEETATRLQSLGFGRIKAWSAAITIHNGLARSTSGKTFGTDIVVANIHHSKHSSDSGVFGAQGEFVPEAFERMFERFDTDRSGGLDEGEIDRMTDANYQRLGGHLVSKFEFTALLGLAADAGGADSPALSRRRMREFYDGTLFFEVATGNPKGTGQ
jgi:peroxygenase